MTINIGELMTMTHKRRAKGAADNVLNHIPLLRRLKKKGKTNTYDNTGGRTISIPLEYAETEYGRYRGFELLSVNQTEVFDSAEYDPVQSYTTIAISGREQRMNQGEAAVLRLVKAKQKKRRKKP